MGKDVPKMPCEEASQAFKAEPRCFATTHWSVVLNAGRGGTPEAAAALEFLCQTYYYPLYAFVRRQGYDPHAAEDLTQEFFHRFLSREGFTNLAPEKGRFRSFLLASLRNFLNVARVRDSAIKRGGHQVFIPLEEQNVEERYLMDPSSGLGPAGTFDRAWATTLMQRALDQLREDFLREGKADQFERLRVFLSREPIEGEYASAAATADMTSGAFSVAVHRFRQRYGQRVRAEVAQTVEHAADVQEEMRYLFSVLTSE